MAEEQLRLAMQCICNAYAMHMQCICNAYAMHHDGDASQFVDMILLELFDDILISLLGTVVRLCGRHESVQVFCNDLLKLEEPQERELSAAFLSRSSSLCLFFLPGCRPFSSRMWHVCRRVRQTKPVETSLKPLRISGILDRMSRMRLPAYQIFQEERTGPQKLDAERIGG